ncbi:MAG: hypothetical protein Q4D81_00625 [Eubacteriales bacterium]|nr:hypothetical protein [Eubacteriales bacterium]
MNESRGLYRFRENTVQLYKRLEYLLVPVFRFAVSLSLLLLLRRHLGALGPADAVFGSTLLNVILALVCSMFPPGCTALIASLVMLWYLYRLSLEATAICAALLLLCLLLYFRFSPKDTMILLLMPVAYALNLHYAVPVFAGLLFGPGAAAAVIFGLLFTKYVLLVEESLPAIGSTAQAALPTGERLIANFRSLIDGMVQDKSMIILAAALALTVVIVCFFRHLIMAHAWTVAIAAGCIIELLVLLAGDMKFDTNIDLTKVFVGIVLAFVLAQILRFFVYNVDFLRIESVQFEDEDYYYYVRAIPKTMVLPPVTNVEHFSQPGAKERE